MVKSVPIKPTVGWPSSGPMQRDPGPSSATPELSCRGGGWTWPRPQPFAGPISPPPSVVPPLPAGTQHLRPFDAGVPRPRVECGISALISRASSYGATSPQPGYAPLHGPAFVKAVPVASPAVSSADMYTFKAAPWRKPAPQSTPETYEGGQGGVAEASDGAQAEASNFMDAETTADGQPYEAPDTGGVTDDGFAAEGQADEVDGQEASVEAGAEAVMAEAQEAEATAEVEAEAEAGVAEETGGESGFLSQGADAGPPAMMPVDQHQEFLKAQASQDTKRWTEWKTIEEYMWFHRLDQTACRMLQGLAPDRQRQVMQTDLRWVRNKSAFLTVKMRDLDSVINSNNTNNTPDRERRGRKWSSLSRSPSRSRRSRRSSCSRRSRSRSRSGGHLGRRRRLGGLRKRRFMSMVPRRRLRPEAGRSEKQASRSRNPSDEARSRLREEVDAFLERNPVSEMAGLELQRLEPSLQRVVLDGGNFERARNPSAVLRSRIQAAKSGFGAPRPPQLLDPTNLGRALRRAAGEDDLSSASKPPMAALPFYAPRDLPPLPPPPPERLSEAENPHAAPNQRGRPALILPAEDEVVELYLRQSKVTAQAAHALRCLRPEVQRHIMRTMPEDTLLQSPNPSATLWSSITQTIKGPDTDAPVAVRKPQRATRGRSRMVSVVRQSRRRGAARSAEGVEKSTAPDELGPPGGQQARASKEAPDARTLEDEVKAFVAKHNLDRQAAEELQSLPASEQRHVLKKDPSTLKHPSLAVIYHCRKVRDGLAEKERAERSSASAPVANPQEVVAAKRARYANVVPAAPPPAAAHPAGGPQPAPGRGGHPAAASSASAPGVVESRAGGGRRSSASGGARSTAPAAPQAVAFTLVRCGTHGATAQVPPEVEIPAVARKFVLGRDAANCDVVFNIQHVSKVHAVLHLSQEADGSWLLMLQDTSTHGTRLNGQKMIPRRLVQVQPGDLISLLPQSGSGNDLLTYEVVPGDAGDGDSGGTGTPPLLPGDASPPPSAAAAQSMQRTPPSHTAAPSGGNLDLSRWIRGIEGGSLAQYEDCITSTYTDLEQVRELYADRPDDFFEDISVEVQEHRHAFRRALTQLQSTGA